MLFVLAAYRLIAPGSEWRLHREWYGRTALSDLLGADEALADPHVLYGCHDQLLAHKEALFTHLTGRWRDLFNVSFEVLLYDLTSTYFESDPPLDENDKRRHGYSRDHRFDCVQIVIALIVTPEGLPLAYEILPGNTNDSKLSAVAPLRCEGKPFKLDDVRKAIGDVGDGKIFVFELTQVVRIRTGERGAGAI